MSISNRKIIPAREKLFREKLSGLILLGALFMSVFAFAGSAVAQGDFPALVTTDAVRMEDISATQPVIGRIVPRRGGDVAALVGGPVEFVYYEVGDRVAFRDVLAQISTARLDIELAQAQANAAEAQAAEQTAQARLELARQELARMEGLRQSAAFSPARLEDLSRERDIAAAEALEAAAHYDLAQAQIDLIELGIERSQIKAPYDGVVTRRYVERGDWASDGEPVFTLLDDSELEVEADVPVRLIPGLQVGRIVTAGLDDGTMHEARLRALVPDENPLTRTRAARFVLQLGETEDPIAANQTVRLMLPVGAPREALTVHKDGVLMRPGGIQAYVNAGGVAEMRIITIGEAQGSRFEVLTGLEAGDQVVVRGNEGLFPGQNLMTPDAMAGQAPAADIPASADEGDSE